MELSQEQINSISSYIFLNDIKEYINTHRLEYKEFIELNKEKGNI